MEMKQMGAIRKGRFKGVNEGREEILYDLPSRRGMGGAPIILIDRSQKLSIIGIHKGEYLTHEG
jgi:hypothetical protein